MIYQPCPSGQAAFQALEILNESAMLNMKISAAILYITIQII
jgi:hypothetical protein